MTVSVIIAVKIWNRYLAECIKKCLELDYPDFEILIMPDNPFQGQSLPVQQAGPSGRVPIQVIPTGSVSPAKKRDMALDYAKGDILAFIDDDAYPRIDWLKNALKNFAHPQVAAVGGPAVTPEEDNLRQKASSAVYASFVVSAKHRYRYLPGKKREVDDYPSCNFLVRKSIMQELGGFKTNFWPGEDTKLCLEIIKKLGKKIIYDPEVLVYHHRRPLFLAHLKQIAAYALHRGYFAKKFPQTSLRLPYFIPTIFTFFLLTGICLSLISSQVRFLFLYGLLLYLIVTFIFSFSKAPRLLLLVFIGTIFTHLTYGLYFLKGLFSGKLKEE